MIHVWPGRRRRYPGPKAYLRRQLLTPLTPPILSGYCERGRQWRPRSAPGGFFISGTRSRISAPRTSPLPTRTRTRTTPQRPRAPRSSSATRADPNVPCAGRVQPRDLRYALGYRQRVIDVARTWRGRSSDGRSRLCRDVAPGVVPATRTACGAAHDSDTFDRHSRCTAETGRNVSATRSPWFNHRWGNLPTARAALGHAGSDDLRAGVRLFLLRLPRRRCLRPLATPAAVHTASTRCACSVQPAIVCLRLRLHLRLHLHLRPGGEPRAHVYRDSIWVR